MTTRTARRPRSTRLTDRERAILSQAGRGQTNQEVADRLRISVRTVKCLLHRACVKLGARNRDQAVIQALRRKEIGIHDIFSVDELAELVASAPPETMAEIVRRVRHLHGADAAQSDLDEIAAAGTATGVS